MCKGCPLTYKQAKPTQTHMNCMQGTAATHMLANIKGHSGPTIHSSIMQSQYKSQNPRTPSHAHNKHCQHHCTNFHSLPAVYIRFQKGRSLVSVPTQHTEMSCGRSCLPSGPAQHAGTPRGVQPRRRTPSSPQGHTRLGRWTLCPQQTSCRPLNRCVSQRP